MQGGPKKVGLLSLLKGGECILKLALKECPKCLHKLCGRKLCAAGSESLYMSGFYRDDSRDIYSLC